MAQHNSRRDPKVRLAARMSSGMLAALGGLIPYAQHLAGVPAVSHPESAASVR